MKEDFPIIANNSHRSFPFLYKERLRVVTTLHRAETYRNAIKRHINKSCHPSVHNILIKDTFFKIKRAQV